MASKVRTFLGVVVVLGSVLAAANGAAAPKERLVERTRFMMGTYVTIFVAGPEEEAARAAELALDRMEEVDKKFHAGNPDSPVYAFNHEGIPIADPEILGVVKAALEISEKTDGAFDITVAPLVELWGFFGDAPRLPGPEEIDDCLSRVGRERVAVRDGELVTLEERTSIDLGAIAKGHAVGQGIEVLRDRGVTSALIDAGGDIYALGRRGEDLWKVGIRDPRSEELLGYIEVEDLAVMGSGDYERFFIEGGRRYHHIIDPATGYPACELSGIVVTSSDPMLADAWATALFVLGPEKGMGVLQTEPGVHAIMTTVDGGTLTSAGFGAPLRAVPTGK